MGVMYINTRTNTDIIKSLEKLFSVSKMELEVFVIDLKRRKQMNYQFDEDYIDNLIDSYVSEKNQGQLVIDDVLFYHLSSRLNSTDNINTSLTLLDLLTTANDFSKLLIKHNIIIQDIDNQLEIFFNEKHILLDKTHLPCCCYLRNRLGHNKGEKDYCVNGFLFKEYLKENDYYKRLNEVPEFIDQLCQYLAYRALGEEYYKNSSFYCFTYLIPLEEIIFDGLPSLTSKLDKQNYILRTIFHRLIYTYKEGNENNHDIDNPIIRLNDFTNINEDKFITKEVF